MLLEHSRLIDKRGVKDGIRILLKRENPFFFTRADAVPHGESALNGGAARLMIAHHASKEAKIGGWDAVMVVEV